MTYLAEGDILHAQTQSGMGRMQAINHLQGRGGAHRVSALQRLRQEFPRLRQDNAS